MTNKNSNKTFRYKIKPHIKSSKRKLVQRVIQNFLIFIDFIHKAETRRNGSSPVSFLKCSQQPTLSQAGAGSKELTPDLPHGWQESKLLAHHLQFAKTLKQEAGLESRARTPGQEETSPLCQMPALGKMLLGGTQKTLGIKGKKKQYMTFYLN